MKIVPMKPNPGQHAIGLFQELLARAEAGEIVEVALVYTRVDRSYVTRTTPIDNLPEVIGKLTVLVSDIVANTKK